MLRIYPVLIRMGNQDARSFSGEFQTKKEHASGWKAVLQQAKQSEAVVTCGCSGQGAKRLAVRRCHYEIGAHVLARYPNSGDQHALDCSYYAPNPDRSGLSGYQRGVVEEIPGGFKIRVIGLVRRSPSEKDPEDIEVKPTPTPSGGRQSQPGMKLLGILHMLWDNSKLNVWWPEMAGKRGTGVVNRELNKAAAQITASRIRLDNALLLPAFSQDDPWAKLNRSRLSAGDKSSYLVVAPLAKHSMENEKMSFLRIAGFEGIPYMNITSALWDRTCERFARAITAWRNHQRVMAIALIKLKPAMPKAKGRSAEVIDLALMPVSESWIPFESQYEKLIADKLVTERRVFVKPLRYDADDSVVFPDFILHDTGKETPLEVFGRTDEVYAARKAEKTAYYEKEYGTRNWWCWDATTDKEGKNIPPFPPRQG
jgi:hypothetical protein